jgi:hypothetical protein
LRSFSASFEVVALFQSAARTELFSELGSRALFQSTANQDTTQPEEKLTARQAKVVEGLHEF